MFSYIVTVHDSIGYALHKFVYGRKDVEGTNTKRLWYAKCRGERLTCCHKITPITVRKCIALNKTNKLAIFLHLLRKLLLILISTNFYATTKSLKETCSHLQIERTIRPLQRNWYTDWTHYMVINSNTTQRTLVGGFGVGKADGLSNRSSRCQVWSTVFPIRSGPRSEIGRGVRHQQEVTFLTPPWPRRGVEKGELLGRRYLCSRVEARSFVLAGATLDAPPLLPTESTGSTVSQSQERVVTTTWEEEDSTSAFPERMGQSLEDRAIKDKPVINRSYFTYFCAPLFLKYRIFNFYNLYVITRCFGTYNSNQSNIFINRIILKIWKSVD